MAPGRLVFSSGKTTDPYCSICKGIEFVEDYKEGQIVCCSCGVVVHDGLYVQDGGVFKYDDNGYTLNSRHGAAINPLLAESSLSTMIGPGGKLSHTVRRIHQQLSMPSRERSLFHKFKEISKAISTMRIESETVEQQAHTLWKDLKEQKVITKGNKNQALVACCVYYACKMCNFKRTRDELTAVLCVERKKFKQAESIFLTKLMNKPYFKQCLAENTADDYVMTTVMKLGIPERARWSVVKEVRRLNEIVMKSEHLCNRQLNPIMATLITMSSFKLGTCIPCTSLTTPNAIHHEGSMNNYSPALIPLTLSIIANKLQVNEQTVKSLLRLLRDIPGMVSQDIDVILEINNKRRRYCSAASVNWPPSSTAV